MWRCQSEAACRLPEPLNWCSSIKRNACFHSFIYYTTPVISVVCLYWFINFHWRMVGSETPVPLENEQVLIPKVRLTFSVTDQKAFYVPKHAGISLPEETYKNHPKTSFYVWHVYVTLRAEDVNPNARHGGLTDRFAEHVVRINCENSWQTQQMTRQILC